MSRQRLSRLVAVATATVALHTGAAAQQARPGVPHAATPVTVTANEPFATLVPRLLALLPAEQLAKVDATLAAEDRPGLAARIAALTPALGDVATAWLDPDSPAAAPRFALRIGFAEPAGRDAAQLFVLQLLEDWTRVAPGDVWHASWDTKDDWWELGGQGEQRLCVAVSERGLTIANSQQWFGELRRAGCFAGALELPQPGHLRVTTPLQRLRPQLVRPQSSGRDEIGRALQVGLDVLGAGTVRIDVGIDALDRLAAFQPL